jgi:hypothetical protein
MGVWTLVSVTVTNDTMVVAVQAEGQLSGQAPPAGHAPGGYDTGFADVNAERTNTARVVIWREEIMVDKDLDQSKEMREDKWERRSVIACSLLK